jgi:hypothetical protein
VPPADTWDKALVGKRAKNIVARNKKDGIMRVMKKPEQNRGFSYQNAAESMAIHIKGILIRLQPDGDGHYPELSEEDVEEIYLLSEIFTKCQPAKMVFDDLANSER